MAYSQPWLDDPTRARGLLVVAKVHKVSTTSEITLCFSTMAFATLDGTIFNPIITRDLEIEESISLDNAISVTYGDIELQNSNGELDDYLNISKYIWSNRSIKVYYGDPRWSVTSIADLGHATIENTFELIYDGIIEDCLSRNRGVVNLVLRDKLQNLNVSITERTIGTTGVWGTTPQTNQDAIQPLIFGEVYNITPVLVDPSLLKYRFNDDLSEAERLIEIRDSGVPIYNSLDTSGATVSTSGGTFSLTQKPAGTITCSVQGVKTNFDVSSNSVLSPASYRNTIPDIIRLMVTSYGDADKRFTSAEIDNSSFKSVIDWFGTDVPACGIAILDRENLLQVVQELASSIGCQVYVNRKGILKLLRLGITSTSSATIEDKDILLNSLSIKEKTNFIGAVKLAYCKNYTLQTNLTTFIPETSREDFATEWLLKTVVDTSVANLYKLTTEPPKKETYLITTATTQKEAERLLNYYKKQRTIYKFTTTSKFISLNLGDWITLKHNRFNLKNGELGQIVSISPQWCRGLVNLEVIV